MSDIQTYATSFRPDIKLKSKYILYILTFILPIYLFSNGLFLLIDITDDTFPSEARTKILIYSTIASLILVFLIILLSNKYYNSISYEVVENEIHVFRGIITKTRKVVPYRTITNLEIKKGPYDRALGIGTIEIQTAGGSAAKPGPEEKIDGIPEANLLALQEYIIEYVRNITGSPGTSHDLDIKPGESVEREILFEIRELRKFLLANFSKDKN